MLLRMPKWLTSMAEREGVGQNRLQFTTRKSMSLGLMPARRPLQHVMYRTRHCSPHQMPQWQHASLLVHQLL